MNIIGILINAYNEESRILDVIESAKLISNDILVLDNNSTDRTVELANSIKNVNVISHDIPLTNYADRIELGIKSLIQSNADLQFIGHLNCSEKFNPKLAKYLSNMELSDFSAIAVYRNARTNSCPTHPYHLLYLLRHLLKRHKTYRFVAVDQWNRSLCRIHAEWQPYDRKKVHSVPFWKATMDSDRIDNIDIVELKHMKYANTESLSKTYSSRLSIILRLFLRPLFYFTYNLPYLIFSYSDKRLISVVQHCYYMASVYIRMLQNKNSK